MNPLKTRLLNGQPCIGGWLHLADASVTEMLAQQAFDALVIDLEHGQATTESLLPLLQVFSSSTVTPIIRVPGHDAMDLKRVMDRGATSLMIPGVNNVDEGRACVSACRYPPNGTRGVGVSVIRASDYGQNSRDYVSNVEKNTLLIAQVESVEAVSGIDAICAVDGIDMIFIGPADLSASMGIADQFEHSNFVACREKIEKATLDAGKLLGGLPLPGRTTKEWFELGYNLLVGTSDVVLLREGSERYLKQNKPD